MSRRVQEIITTHTGRPIISRGCPNHLSITAVERCTRCYGILMAQLAKRAALDEQEARSK